MGLFVGIYFISNRQWLIGGLFTLFSLVITGQYRHLSQLNQHSKTKDISIDREDEIKELLLQKERVTRDIQNLRMKWQNWLEQHQLQAEVSTITIFDTISLILETKELIKKQDHLNDNIDLIQREIETFEKQLIEMDRNGIGRIEEVVYHWVQQLQKDQENEIKRTQWGQRVDEIDAEIQRFTVQIEMERTKINQLFQYANVHNKEEYYYRASEYDNYRQLQAEQKQLIFSIRNGCIDERDYHRLIQLYNENEQTDIEQHFQQHKRQLDILQERVKVILERKGELQSQIKEMEDDTSLTALRQEYNILLSRLRENVKERVKTSITKHLLLQTMKIYETEKQPHVVKKASEYFRIMTGSQYERVFAPIDEATLKVLRSDGQIFEPQYLSEGTQEQLFIAMRFALIEEFAKKVELPLIFDDIFVNFDHLRLQYILNSLAELAKNHQILFFTCHYQLHSKMKESIGSVHYISLNQQETNLSVNK
ncbi:hypothetical protein [Tepidibacillus marianensis]|uniref:ATP-binding protein n=1 Tax=Tepidibacillus marianensis TaxID=3131995 RepID=UPI0030CAF374